jgi:F-type H+-transporting ATPase subunit epsilon
MPVRTFTLQVVTPERVLYEGEVESLVAPGMEGMFGILANHMPFLAALRPGPLRFRDAEGREWLMAITGGFFQVFQNRATVLADAAEFAAEIDLEAAQRELEEARELLRRALTEKQIDVEAVQEAMERTRARIRVASMVRQG